MKYDAKQLQEVIDSIFGFLPGCPEAAMRSVIPIVTEEYVRNIGGIVASVTGKDFSDDNANVLSAPFGGRVISVRKVFVNDIEMPHESYDVVRIGPNLSLSFSGIGGLITPSGSTFKWGARYTWEPDDMTEMLPLDWWMAHKRAIRNGVLATMLSQGAPWANDRNAARFIKEYENNIHDAIMDMRMEEAPGGKPSIIDRNNPFIPIM